MRAAPNRLRDQPVPTVPNQVWVGDITYLSKQGSGWLYLPTRLNRCSLNVVGRTVRETMPEGLVSEARPRALIMRLPAAGLVVRSDWGSKYAATNFMALAAHHEAVRGNCYDNAYAESFWSWLKIKLLAGGSFRKLSEAGIHNAQYTPGWVIGAIVEKDGRNSTRSYLLMLTQPTSDFSRNATLSNHSGPNR